MDLFNQNMDEFHACRELFSNDGVRYTPMKLIEMFFRQIGYMMDYYVIYQEEMDAIYI